MMRAVVSLVLIVLAVCVLAASVPARAAQGVSYLVLELDVDTLRERRLEELSEALASEFRTAAAPIRIENRGVADGAARLHLADVADLPRARQIVEEYARSLETATALVISDRAEGVLDVRFAPAYWALLTQQAQRMSVEVARRRVDPEDRRPHFGSAARDTTHPHRGARRRRSGNIAPAARHHGPVGIPCRPTS